MDATEQSEDISSKWTDILSKMTGLPFFLRYETRYSPGLEGESPLCRLLQGGSAGRAFCEQECTRPLVQAVKSGETIFFKCYANLNNVAIPVHSFETPYKKCILMGGRVITSYEDLVAYRSVAEKMGCESDRVLETIRRIEIKDMDRFRIAMEAVKTGTGFLIHSIGRYKKIEDKIERMKAIVRVVCSAGAIRDDGEFYRTILTTLGVLFNAKTALLMSKDLSGERFVAREVFGYGKDSLSGFECNGNKGLIGEAVVRNEVVSSTELFEVMKSGFPNGFTSVKIFPISVDDRVEGLIVILNTPLSSEEEDLLRSFCKAIAVSFENRSIALRRETFARKGLLLLDALYSIAAYIDSPELFDVIIEKSSEVTEAEQGSIMLLDEDRESLEVKATRGLNPAVLQHIRISPGEGIAGLVMTSGTPLIVGNIEKDDRISRPNRVRYKTKSFMIYPLKIRNKCIGVINLSDKKGGADFTDRDMKLLEAIALYSAVAIERRFYYQSSISLRKISITDPLSGLLNRRYFEERISEEMERSRRHRQPFSLIILDIDNFKDFNDTYGHPMGDEALKCAGQVIRRCIRIIDIAARYGGEEFAIILPTTDKEDALLIGERIRDEIEKMSVVCRESGKIVGLTVSLGVASYPDDASNIEELVNNADRALYRAKNSGKNRVVSFGTI